MQQLYRKNRYTNNLELKLNTLLKGSLLALRVKKEPLTCMERFYSTKVYLLWNNVLLHALEGQSAAEFSSNPDQTHLPVIF